MRLSELALVYLALGVIVAVALARRGSSVTDVLLSVVLFPIFVPVLLERRGVPEAAKSGAHRADEEADRLVTSIESVSDQAIANLLPKKAHIEKLRKHLHVLEAKIVELDAVLRDNDLDEARAIEALRLAAEKGAAERENAELSLASVRRLLRLREVAIAERDSTILLMVRLRLQITVARFAGGPPPSELVSEILARVEGVTEALGADLV